MAAEVITLPDVCRAIDALGSTALRIKAQRDHMQAALEDLVLGAELMLDPGLFLSDSFRRYVLEVRKVAKEGLS